MKSLLRSLAVVFLLIAFSAPNLLAASSRSGDLLVQAYAVLEKADHDYNGHRIAAMKQIEAAGKLSGVNVRGDGKGHEKQGISDEQLRTAKGLLEQAQGGLTGRAKKHVNKAIGDLSTALKIK